MAWPTTTDDDASLYVAVNNLQTTLNGAIDASTTTVVHTSAAACPATGGFITIGSEAIKYTGKSTNTLTGVTRGADGTTAASHDNGAPVFGFTVAAHHNALKDAVKALEAGAATKAAPAFTGDATFDTDTLVVDATNNRVGVKAATPAYTLDVGGFASAAHTVRVGSTSNNSSIRLMEASDDYGFSIQNVAGSRLGVYRHNNDATGVEVLSVDRGNGNVGIGASSPGSPLEVAGTIRSKTSSFYL